MANSTTAANTVGLTVGSTRDHEMRLTAAETVPLLTTVPAMANADVTETLVAALSVAVRRWRAAKGGTRTHHWCWTWNATVATGGTPIWTCPAPSAGSPRSHRCGCHANTSDDHVAVLKETKERLRAVADGGLGFGQLRYCNPRTAAALGRLPAPQLLFNYLGRWAADGTADWDSAPEVAALRGGPDPDLGTPYLLEINAICDETVDGPRAACDAHLRRRGAGRGLRRRPCRALDGGAARAGSARAAARRRPPSRRRT